MINLNDLAAGAMMALLFFGTIWILAPSFRQSSQKKKESSQTALVFPSGEVYWGGKRITLAQAHKQGLRLKYVEPEKRNHNPWRLQ